MQKFVPEFVPENVVGAKAQWQVVRDKSFVTRLSCLFVLRMWLDVGCWFTVPERTAVQIPAHHARRALAQGFSSREAATHGRGSDLEDRHTAKGSSRYYGAAPWADCSGRVQSTTRVSEGTHIGTEGRDTASTQCQGQGSRAGPSCSSGRRAESWPTAGKPVCLSPSADVQPELATSFCASTQQFLHQMIGNLAKRLGCLLLSAITYNCQYGGFAKTL